MLFVSAKFTCVSLTAGSSGDRKKRRVASQGPSISSISGFVESLSSAFGFAAASVFRADTPCPPPPPPSADGAEAGPRRKTANIATNTADTLQLLFIALARTRYLYILMRHFW